MVVGRVVEERTFTAFEDALRDDRRESRGEAASAVVGMGADRADLPEPGGRESLPGHGDQSGAVEHADVPAEIDGADRERSRAGELDQREHLADVVAAERAGPDRRVGRLELPEHHLVADALGHDRPAGRCRRRVGTEERTRALADERGEVAPTLVGVVAERREHRHLRVVAGRSVLALANAWCGPASECHTALSSSIGSGSIMGTGLPETRSYGEVIPSPLGCGHGQSEEAGRCQHAAWESRGTPRQEAEVEGSQEQQASRIAPEPSAPGLCPPGEEAGESATMVGRPGVGVPADPILTRPDVRSPRISKSVRRA